MTRKQIRIAKQKGISIVIVLFLLAVVSGLVISLTRLTGTQHLNTLYSYRGTQAYFAARAGLDYAIARVAGGNACAIDSPLTISGYDVTVTCAQVGPVYNEGNPALPYRVYTLSAWASAGDLLLPNATNRRLQASVRYP